MSQEQLLFSRVNKTSYQSFDSEHLGFYVVTYDLVVIPRMTFGASCELFVSSCRLHLTFRLSVYVSKGLQPGLTFLMRVPYA
jgi:hypothetical protein